MATTTNIEWTDVTWNPTVGCDRVSPGCAKCYAKTLHDRRHKASLAGKKMAAQYAQPFEVLQTLDTRLDAPLRWRAPRRVFVNSVSDLFHEDVPDAFIDRVFAVMALAPQHTFQILTKRAERMRAYLTTDGRAERWNGAADRLDISDGPRKQIRDRAGEDGLSRDETLLYRECDSATDSRTKPLDNVWLGVSVENPPFLKRLDELMQTPAALRFVSLEPLLADVGDLSRWLYRTRERRGLACAMYSGFPEERIVPALDWVIVGVESGTGRRNQEAYEDHARAVLTQCAAAGVAAFHKQMPIRGRVSHDPSEWAPDLQVREFPEVRA